MIAGLRLVWEGNIVCKFVNVLEIVFVTACFKFYIFMLITTFSTVMTCILFYLSFNHVL